VSRILKAFGALNIKSLPYVKKVAAFKKIKFVSLKERAGVI